MKKVRHEYKGWIILRVAPRDYIAERQSDHHIAPIHFRRLKDAKESIDSGEAALSHTEWMAKKLQQEMQAFPETIPAIEKSAYNGYEPAKLALDRRQRCI